MGPNGRHGRVLLRDAGDRHGRGADGKLRITLNGKILFNMANLDQGFWPDGLYTAPTDAALAFDLKQDKAMGFNAVRKHIKVEPDRWYYWADKLGLMIWQDMPAANTGPIPPEWRGQFESELHEMVREHQSGRRSSPGCRSTRAGASGAGRTPGGSPPRSRPRTRPGWSTRTAGSTAATRTATPGPAT